MRKLLGLTLMLVCLAAVGCASSNPGAMSGISPEQARQMNGERNIFETTEDPPITAETHFAAGQVSETQNDFNKAAKQYSEALKLNPNHVNALYRMGVCLSHLKKHSQAINVWKKYIELTGGDAIAWSDLGFCYELSGNIDDAEAAYKQGIEKDSKCIPCRTNYGLMLARLGRHSEAVIQLQSVLSRAEVYYNIASVYEHQGRKEQARIEYERALIQDPMFKDARARLSALSED